MLTVLLWLAYLLAGVIHMSATKVSVRALGKGADNAWDNAFGYLVAAYLLTWPARWLWESQSWWLAALILPLFALASVFVLKVIYELSTRRAVAIGALHTALTSMMLSAASLVVGFIAAYIMYGKIVSDPLMLIRLVFKLIGITPPF